MDLSESTPSNRRDFRQEIAIFNPLGFSGDKLNHISIYKKMTKSEKEVAELLKNLGIQWSYERPIFMWDENNRPRVWTPDFYLPELGIYIEVCGSQNFDYKFRNEVYQHNSIPIVFIHWYKEKEKWKKYLRKRIQEIEKERRQKVDYMIESLLENKQPAGSITKN